MGNKRRQTKSTKNLPAGQERDQMIGDMAAEIAGPGTPDEGYLERLGRMNQARATAQEIVDEQPTAPGRADRG